MSDCLFCKIVAGEVPADKLYEDDHVLAFRDISPQAPHHFIVIPKKHITAPSTLAEEDEALMGKLVRAGSKVAADLGIEGQFRLVVNNGADAGQVIFHMHLHFLGGRKMGWPPG